MRPPRQSAATSDQGVGKELNLSAEAPAAKQRGTEVRIRGSEASACCRKWTSAWSSFTGPPSRVREPATSSGDEELTIRGSLKHRFDKSGVGWGRRKGRLSPLVVGAPMARDGAPMRPSANGSWTAIGVHVFTALGAVCAFFATLALIGRAERMFLWLGAALLIDGLDGPLARRLTAPSACRGSPASGSTWSSIISPTSSSRLWRCGRRACSARSGSRSWRDPRLLPVPLRRRPGEQGRGQQLRRLPGHLEPGRVLSLRVRCRSRRGRAGGRRGHRADVRSLALVVRCERASAPRPLAALALWAGAAAWTLALGFPAPPIAQLAPIAAAVYGVGLTLLRRRG